MAMTNPQGRINFEPNSFGVQDDPRESPEGFHSYPAQESGEKLRIRAESFADHYSQARQFYISQTPTEQNHIIAALVFELSKVERPDIRSRVVSHLLNIHDELAQGVVEGLGLKDVLRLPKPQSQPVPTSNRLMP